MAPSSKSVQSLESLRDLINKSLDAVEQSIIDHDDPALTLDSCESHPIHSRLGADLEVSLKTISSATNMLRALCDPNTYLNDTIYGYHDETALFVACQADIANHLGKDEHSIQILAQKTGLNEEKLARYLRNLCNKQIFRETADNRFANNLLSVTFQSEGKRALVGHCADECRTSSSKAWEALIHPDYKDATEANKAPFNLAYDTDLTVFEWVKSVRPDIGQRANTAMAGKGLNLEQYLALYPWHLEGTKTIIDVGGGVGAGTLPILKENPNLRVRIQDRPESESKFHEYLKNSYPEFEQSDRVKFIGHDFFTPQKEPGDIYFLRHVIHDWPDEEARQILNHCAAKMSLGNKLLILEHMLAPTYRDTSQSSREVAPRPLLANWGQSVVSRLDLQMLACLNAKERTETQYRALIENTGLKVVRVWRNAGLDTVLECIKA
ncbi:unnamed protein product [Penicillium pancosmium]